MKLATALVLGAFTFTPAMADELVVQPPNPGAARVEENTAVRAAHNSQLLQNKAREDQGIANYDASRGNYAGAAAADHAAQQNSVDASRGAQWSRHDSAVARKSDSYSIQERP